MAEICQDIDQAIAALNRKIDEQNKRLRDLERQQKECCDNSNKPKNDNANLTEILKRLTKAETDILDLGGIVGTVIDDLKDLLDAATEHNETADGSQNIFSAIIDFFVDE
jgi:small-conductance mechanosensitive channel